MAGEIKHIYLYKVMTEIDVVDVFVTWGNFACFFNFIWIAKKC